MEKFNIKVVALGNSILAVLLCFGFLLILLTVMNNYFPGSHGQGNAILIGIPVLLVFYFIFQRIAVASTAWVVSEEGLTITWITRFAFTKQTDLSIKWPEVEDYKLVTDSMYRTFKFKLTDGMVYKFYNSQPIFAGGAKRDQFMRMVEMFKKLYAEKRLVE